MNQRVDENPDAVLNRQRAAQRLVSDEIIRGAFDRVRATYLDNWSKTAPNEHDKREIAYMLFKAVSDVWATLERDANTARVRDLKEQAENKNG